MVRIFKTEEGVVRQIEEIESGCWVALTDPTATVSYTHLEEARNTFRPSSLLWEP